MKAVKSIAALAVLAALTQSAFADGEFTTSLGLGSQESTFSASGVTEKQTIPLIRAGFGYNDNALSYAASFAYGRSSSSSDGQSINGHYSQIDGRMSYHIGIGDSFAISPAFDVSRVNQSQNGNSVDLNYATVGFDFAWQMGESFGMVFGAGAGRSFSNSVNSDSINGGMVYTAKLKASYALNRADSVALTYNYRKASLSGANLKTNSLMLNWTHSF